MNLPLMPQDKANHFIYGFVIYLLANILLTDLLSLIIVLIFALAKETYDYYRQGQVELLDVIYTISPALIILLFNLIK